MNMRSLQVLSVALVLLGSTQVIAKPNKLVAATGADIGALGRYIRSGKVDVYMFDLYEKRCRKIVFKKGAKRPFQTTTGKTLFSFSDVNIDMLRRPSVVKEFRRGHRNKMQSTVNKMKFIRTMKLGGTGHPVLWETKALSKVCVSQAVYTDGRVVCRKYLRAGSSIYGFVVGKEVAGKLTNSTCKQ
jgi:hypothetical protein